MTLWHVLLLLLICSQSLQSAPNTALEELGDYIDLSDVHDKKHLQKLFGSDAPKVQRAILEMWAKLVLIMKNKDRKAFIRLLIYPTRFHLVYYDDRTVGMHFSIKTPEHAWRFFPAIFTKNVLEEELKYHPPVCSYYVYHEKSVVLLSDSYNIYLSIRKIPSRRSKETQYYVTIETIFIFSDDYFNDKGKILYELKQLAASGHPRPSTQP